MKNKIIQNQVQNLLYNFALIVYLTLILILKILKHLILKFVIKLYWL